MPTELIFLTVDVATVVCALLLGARLLTTFPRRREAWLIALLCVSAIAHVVLARDDYGYWIPVAYRVEVGGLRPALNLVRNAAPGLFMILVHGLFTDRRGPPAWLLGLFALQLFLEEPVRGLIPPGLGAGYALSELAPTVLQVLFAGFALYWTLADWRRDLIEERRRARAFVLVALAINIVAASVLLRVVIPANSVANYQAHLVLAGVNLALLAFLVLRWMGDEMGAFLGRAPPRGGREQIPRRDDSAAALARLTSLLEDERIYREPRLSLKGLADRVGLPEYRLRRLIHEQLGYRNFNAFLHAWRIREAGEQLRDPALRRIPILTIALSVGYQSVNTFNRGFREVMGVTPSAYRAGPDAGSDAWNRAPETE